MKLIGLGPRPNLKYPFMLLLFILLCRIIELRMKALYKENVYGKLECINPLFIYIPQFLGGFIVILYNYIKNKKKIIEKPKTLDSIEIIQGNNEIHRPDSPKKILLLIILSSYFNFLTILLGKHFFPFEKQKGIDMPTNKFIERRIRSFQILINAILCYLALKIEIYRHQTVSLIVISVFLLIILCFDHFYLHTHIFMLLLYIFHFVIRAFLDTIEKYLFEFNFLNIYKVLAYEGFFSNIFYIILSLADKNTRNEISSLYDDIIKHISEYMNIIIIFLLLIIFMIFSGFRHIYRVYTIKLFTPMTLSLFELLLDPFFVAFTLYIEPPNNFTNFIDFCLIPFCLLIMSFFSLVYNDFIVLYCFGLQKNTYLEIKKRTKTIDNILFTEEEDDDDDDDDESIKKHEIEMKKKL